MNKTNYKNKVLESFNFIKSKINELPKIGLIAGTGLGESTKGLKISASFDYAELPNFPLSTVESHQGRLLFGSLHNKSIVALQGRFHLYEGHTPLEVSFPIRVMKEMGVHTLIISNASGGLNPNFETGQIMIIKDHINLTGENPLVGKNEDSWGIRFPDMTKAYNKRLAEIAKAAGKNLGINLQSGVYVGLKGPSLETPAEMRFLRTIGADAVGFSTIMEVIAAVHSGMRVLGLSTITNMNIPERLVPATVEEIIAVAEAAAPKLETIIAKVIENTEA